MSALLLHFSFLDEFKVVAIVVNHVVHGELTVVVGSGRVVMHRVKRHGRRWDIHWRHSTVNVPIEVLQVQLRKVEEAAE